MEYNIKQETKLIELLGLHVIESKHSSYWLIMDNNLNEVGSIQYKNIMNRHNSKGFTAFRYVTRIESDKIHYTAIRLPEKETPGYTNFYIKQDNVERNNIEITLGKSPSIGIWNKSLGYYMELSVSDDNLCCKFKSKTENYNTEEFIFVKSSRAALPLYDYEYSLKYCEKDKNITNPDECTTVDIKIFNHIGMGGKLDIHFLKWINGASKPEEIAEVEGILLEAIQKHQDGIEAFSHFRYLINRIVPFVEEVITSILKDRGITEPEYLLFFPELEQPQMTSVGETIEEQGPTYVKQ